LLRPVRSQRRDRALQGPLRKRQTSDPRLPPIALTCSPATSHRKKVAQPFPTVPSSLRCVTETLIQQDRDAEMCEATRSAGIARAHSGGAIFSGLKFLLKLRGQLAQVGCFVFEH